MVDGESEYPQWASAWIGQRDADWWESYEARYEPVSDNMKRHMRWGMVIDDVLEEFDVPEPDGPRDLEIRLRGWIRDAIAYNEISESDS